MFFSKIKDLTRFISPKKDLIDLSALQKKLNSGLFSTMEGAFQACMADKGNSKYSPDDIEKIVNGYAKQNMILAAASSVVPGPLGILGAVPELLLNFKNQFGMIYDLSCANDKESFLNKDLLLDIPIAAFGGNTDLMAMQGNAQDLMDSPVAVLQGKVQTLGKGVIERTLKKSVVQFVPIGGPILMGIWAKAATNKVAKTSKSFFDKNDTYVEHFRPEETPEIAREIQVQKIKGLANLIECNNEINEAQIAFIGPIIENADIPQSQKNHLLEESLRTGSNFQLDYDLLRDFEEDEPLIMEMAIMAKRSGSVDGLEKKYILQVADKMKLDKAFVEDLLD